MEGKSKEDKMIDDLVQELTQTTQTESHPSPPSQPQTIPDASEIQSQSSTPSNKQTANQPLPAQQPNQPKPDISALFTGLIQNIMPPELKNNKEMNQVIQSLLSSFSTMGPDSQKDSQHESEKKYEETEDDTEDEDVDDEETEDDEDEETENEDETEEDNVESVDAVDAVEQDIQYHSNEDPLYIVRMNDKLIGYSTDKENAMETAGMLHRDFIYFNEDRYVRTVKHRNGFSVYERNPFSLFPFMERIVCTISVEEIYSL